MDAKNVGVDARDFLHHAGNFPQLGKNLVQDEKVSGVHDKVCAQLEKKLVQDDQESIVHAESFFVDESHFVHHERSFPWDDSVSIVHDANAGEPDETAILHDFFARIMHKEKSMDDFSVGVLHEEKSVDSFSIVVRQRWAILHANASRRKHSLLRFMNKYIVVCPGYFGPGYFVRTGLMGALA